MRKWLALACVATVCGCGSGPTAPTPDFVGNYSFVVEASSVCELPIERFEWNLVATFTRGELNNTPDSFLLTLPGGDPTLSIILRYQLPGGRGRGGGQQQVGSNLTIALKAQDVHFGEGLEVSIGGSVRGVASVSADGRGAIPLGAIEGTLRLAERAPKGGQKEIGSCTAGDHPFTLTPI